MSSKTTALCMMILMLGLAFPGPQAQIPTPVLRQGDRPN